VLMHYLRLSQENLGADLNIEIGQGTCTMKYNPKINEHIARMSEMTELHPLQDEETVQGMLEIMHKLDLTMREISGMDQFSFQSGGGSQAALLMASIARGYHRENGEEDQRNEVITTAYSHPSDAATPATKGYKVITIMADKDGYPDYKAFKAAVSERTAAFIVANPEDTGVFNSRVKEFTKLVTDVGGLNCYDQANANGLLGVTRAKEAGFDMCYFNLHKTFATPHGCGGPGGGALGVVEKLKDYLPKPIVEFKDDTYYLNYDLDKSIGKIRVFNGVPQTVLRAYAWIRSLGAEGLYEVAKVAVLNNNYLFKKLLEHKAIDAPYIEGKQRIEQVRYTLEKLENDTGIGIAEVTQRLMDFGMHIWSMHLPFYTPEPMTIEPTETPSRDDLDEYARTLHHIFDEAYENPEIAKTAPHRSVIHQVDKSGMDDPEKWAPTWRVYLRKTKED
ncbi:MAG TPA: aminomethyl-transferring glycine dehydrogenase subunit GcvPB, partial [Tissierellaceae bacterium]|nr:aminomethyl-transferring glycine dehydrogenase subunit GcvPB [Tissierellaceae bacterium]